MRYALIMLFMATPALAQIDSNNRADCREAMIQIIQKQVGSRCSQMERDPNADVEKVAQCRQAGQFLRDCKDNFPDLFRH